MRSLRVRRATVGVLALALALVLGLAACAESVETSAGSGPALSTSEIIGGKFAREDLAVVALVAGRRPFCSGTLVSSRVVLTAGHCVTGAPPTGVYFGSWLPLFPGEIVPVESATLHPDYRIDDFRFADIGVVVLARRAKVEPRPFNVTPLGPALVGADVRLVGFGFQQVGAHGIIGQRMELTLPVVLVAEKELEYYRGSCNGDSGGPAFHRFADGVERVVGVTSFGRGDPRCSGNSGSHRVDRHAAWLAAEIARHDPVSCERDYRCADGCAAPDPDCPCRGDDGACSALCDDPAADRDCPLGCGVGDECVSGATCPAPDPDCGDPCGAEGHCVPGCTPRDPDCPPGLAVAAVCAASWECADELLCLAGACTLTCDPAAPVCDVDHECRAVLPERFACLVPVAPAEVADGCSVAVPSPRGGVSVLLLAAGWLCFAACTRHERR